MYHRIVVPLDGSTFAEQALRYAVQVARPTSARVDLVLVHTSYAVATLDNAIHETVGRWQADQREREAVYLKSVAARLQAEHGVEAEPVLLTGTVAQALEQHVQSSGAELVVMTTHGRGRLERVWLGSVAETLMARVRVPVLLVRPEEADAPWQPVEPGFRHIAVALDGSVEGEHCIEPVLGLVEEDTRLTLLRVVTPPRGPVSGYLPHASQLSQQLLADRQHAAEQYLAEVAARVRREHELVAWRVIIDYHAASAIVNWADEHSADGIALSTRGRAPALRLLLGSTAASVVRGGHVPVLVG